MSFGQKKLLTWTLPTTLAAAVFISLLWFKRRQRRGRPPVDDEPGSDATTRHIQGVQPENNWSQSTNSAERQLIDKVDVAKVSESVEVVQPSSVEVIDVEEYSLNSDNQTKDFPAISRQSETLPSNEEVKKLSITQELSCQTIMAKEAKIICEIPKRSDKDSLEDCSNDLEEGEIRSKSDDFSNKNTNFDVSKQESEDKDSVFDSEDSGKCNENVESDLEEGEIRSTDGSFSEVGKTSGTDIGGGDETVLEEGKTGSVVGRRCRRTTEDSLEEGEIRSTDSRSQENLQKDSEELSQKLASLELGHHQIKRSSEEGGDGKETRGGGEERDSANHSPSEVMLASPSISAFSDAQSEGSSDSGKGQSDAALSPARTPAGGSSLAGDLAGDLAPSVYEFILPQVIVGRLIGRHGAFLHEIKTQTHTNIFIKRHPDSNKLKICAIEGSQQDIDKALKKIRQKFPLRRFPQLTLEKVSFVQVSPLPPLKPEDFHLTLIEGVNNDVVLSSLLSAGHFFLQQPCHPSYGSLGALNSIMSQLYSSGEAPLIQTPVTYAICAAPAMGGWYRAQIVHVDREPGAAGDDEEEGGGGDVWCTVRYLDYGGYSRVQPEHLRQIRGDLLALPFQAVECYLANVAPPPGEEWSEEARLFVHSLTCGQVLQAQVYGYADDGNPLVYLYAKFANQESALGFSEPYSVPSEVLAAALRTEALEDGSLKPKALCKQWKSLIVVLVNEELVVHGYGVIAETLPSRGESPQEDKKTLVAATPGEEEETKITELTATARSATVATVVQQPEETPSPPILPSPPLRTSQSVA